MSKKEADRARTVADVRRVLASLGDGGAHAGRPILPARPVTVGCVEKRVYRVDAGCRIGQRKQRQALGEDTQRPSVAGHPVLQSTPVELSLGNSLNRQGM